MACNQPCPSIHFISLGCARNVVDTEVMVGLVKKEGYTITPYLEKADFVVINTCGFLEASRQEALQTITHILEKKKRKTKVIVTGCFVQLKDSALKPYSNDIHYLLGSGEIENILTAIKSTSPGSIISNNKSFLEHETTPRILSTPPHYAYVKIAEGCRKHCSYCIIPTIKGPLRSKPEKQIIQEVTSLLDQGVKELILVAQDLGDWGKDLDFHGTEGLIYLIKKILEIKKEFSLRLLYVYPDEISPEFVSLLASDPRIIHYLDMPIQHCSDSILRAMYRKTSKRHIEENIRMLQDAMPDMSLRTSIIVGFPGEDESHFEELCAFVEKGYFLHLGIFSYSQEEQSASFAFPNHVPDDVKESRCRRLKSVQKKVVKKALQKMIGTKIPVIIDGYHPETKLLLCGRHAGQCPEADSIVIINDASQVRSFGESYLVEITGVSDYDLVGKAIKLIG